MQTLRETIFELMNVPEEQCDLDWLKNSLQAAIKLEFSTLPPYLCALWSIKDVDADGNPTGPVADSIKDQIALEEMLHMGLACNLLTAIDGTPSLNTSDGVPSYPGSLPGNVNPELEISLRGLSKEAVLGFLEIEQPNFPPLISSKFTFGLEKLQENVDTFPTIGDFYSYILRTFNVLKPDLKIDKQVEFYLPKSIVIKTLADVEMAIQTIQLQGEGSQISPSDDGIKDATLKDLAHYYRFAEINNGKKLILVDGQLKFEGADIPFPEAFPMAKIPLGGYKKEQIRTEVRDEVGQVLDEFDLNFTQMMNQLQEAWTNDPTAIRRAVRSMRSLQLPAQKLMAVSILADGSSGHFGPCFRLVATS
jgi:Ferritin-like